MISARDPSLVALGLGGNTGDPERAFVAAIEALESVAGPLRVASLYRSEALTSTPQDDYLNTVIVGSTTVEPLELLGTAKDLEFRAGRRPGPPESPRPLDIDLLLYGEQSLSRPELTVPHRKLRQRRFVLAPLAELVPNLPVPPDGRAVLDLLLDLGEEQRIERIEWRAKVLRARPRADRT